MDSLPRQFQAPLLAAVAMLAQWILCGWLGKTSGRARPGWVVKVIRAWRWVGTLWLVVPFLWLHPVWGGRLSEIGWIVWTRGLGLLWAIIVIPLFGAIAICRVTPAFDPDRRRFLGAARAATLAAPFAASGIAFAVERSDFRLVETDVSLPGLPQDLDGLRVVQLSDIHLSPFLTGEELDRAVDMANEVRAHVAVVTGDLITVEDHLLADCLRRLKRLRADAGVFGCLGNHEVVARCQDRAKQEGAGLGIDFLRGEARTLRFGAATLNLAGVDYQSTNRPYLSGVEALVRRGAVNLLLSHNPDVFDVAARQGWDVTLAGHTHGGQVTVEFLQQYLNVARVYTPYVCGLYRKKGSAIYVTRGIGTVGIPARIGAPPEVALIRLCAT